MNDAGRLPDPPSVHRPFRRALRDRGRARAARVGRVAWRHRNLPRQARRPNALTRSSVPMTAPGGERRPAPRRPGCPGAAPRPRTTETRPPGDAGREIEVPPEGGRSAAHARRPLNGAAYAAPSIHDRHRRARVVGRRGGHRRLLRRSAGALTRRAATCRSGTSWRPLLIWSSDPIGCFSQRSRMASSASASPAPRHTRTAWRAARLQCF